MSSPVAQKAHKAEDYNSKSTSWVETVRGEIIIIITILCLNPSNSHLIICIFLLQRIHRRSCMVILSVDNR